MDCNKSQSLSAEIIINNYLHNDLDSGELSDLKILGISYQKSRENLTCDSTAVCHSMFVLLGGNINIYADSKPILFSKNQILIKFPHGSVRCSGVGELVDYIRIDFDGTNAPKLCGRCMLTDVSPIYKSATPEIIEKLLSMTQCDDLLLSKDIAMIASFYQVFSMMIENLCKGTHCTDKEHYILSILEYIKVNYRKPTLTLKDVSNHVSLHFNYISQLFKKVTGISFSRYINLYRIQKACEIIDSGEFFIKDVANKVGFEDPLHFSKVFKSIKGISPKNYSKAQNPAVK